MRKKKRRVYQLRHRSRLNHSVPFLTGIVLILAIGLFLFVDLRNLRESDAALQALPIPHVREVESPPPLVISEGQSSVLGLGTFDPLEIVTEVNKERAKVASPPLRINETLMRAAQLRADVIVKHENFSHYDPYENIILGTVLPKFNYHFVYASENIGMGGGSGRDFVKGFMASTSHRNNLLDAKLTETGVGIADGPYDRYYVNIVVQLFAIPAGKVEYLGYSPSDQAFYQTQLTAISTNLDPITWFLLKLNNPDHYSEEKRKMLVRQKEILETVIKVMKKEEPLQNDHVAMIREYNKNLGNL